MLGMLGMGMMSVVDMGMATDIIVINSRAVWLMVVNVMLRMMTVTAATVFLNRTGTGR